MHDLGGSASIAEQEDRVAANLHLSDKDVAEIHRGISKCSSRCQPRHSNGFASGYFERVALLK